MSTSPGLMPISRCDGCNAGQQLRGNLHIADDGSVIACQAGLYQSDLFGDVPVPVEKETPRKAFKRQFCTVDDIMRMAGRYDTEDLIDRIDSRLGLRSFVVSGTVWSVEDAQRIVGELKGK